jgi:protein O-mannosyl-transferase
VKRPAPLLLVAAVVAAFFPLLRHPYLRLFDEPSIVFNQNLSFGLDELKWMFSGSVLGQWQPLTWLSLAVDRALFGAAPAGTRAANLLLHALNAVLVYRLGRALLPGDERRAELGAAAAALLWALHPLRVETLAFASLRRDLLGTAFALGAVLASRDGRRLAAHALGACAALSHPWGALVPGALALAGSTERGRRDGLLLLPWGLAAVIMGAGAQAETGAYHPLASFPLSSRLAQAVHAPVFYAAKTLLPLGLSPHYERSSLLEPRVFSLCLVLVVLAAGGALLLRRRAPRAFAALAGYALLLLPALGLFKVGRVIAADRWSYLPAVPLSLAAGAALGALPRQAALASALALGAALFAATRAHLPVYASDAALWARARALAPELPHPAAMAADAALKDGDGDSFRRLAALSQDLRRAQAERVAAAYEARGDAARAELTRLRALAK